ncbi:MAG: YifB family Mg chelatase-like AAA ATPase [Magnetococcales bacterium]|nr:YifB family Mg chelatase-like AAA ATPase [Magnetococcales bacterium]
MLARVDTVALDGIRAIPVEVEVDLGRGLPMLNMVGLPDGAVREAKDRVRAALKNSGVQLPTRRITINLAPADLPKEGSAYDLPMALGLLAAMEMLPTDSLRGRLFMGELALDGRLKPVPGCLSAAMLAKELALEELVVPMANGGEGAVAGGRVIAPETLLELMRHLTGEKPLEPVPLTDWRQTLAADEPRVGGHLRDLSDVKGQEHARRALEVAAAGGHNLIMSGPPGSGKTLLARCLPGILPVLSLDDALEVTAIHSVAGRLDGRTPLITRRPFRTPHHTASHVALIGGGGVPRPGEVSLAHRGVLFLDEIPEFGRSALESLREPLESGDVGIARAARSTRFPARFQLVAACNPCPCGFRGHPQRLCRCSPVQVERYASRLSGPLLDRIDLHVDVPPVPPETLTDLPGGEASSQVRQRVHAARQRQAQRNGPGIVNADLDGAPLNRFAALDSESRTLLLMASRKLSFSARTHNRILKVARTIADLDAAEHINAGHLAEAIQFRMGGRFPGCN